MKTRTKLIILIIPVVLAVVVYLRIAGSDPTADTRRQSATLVKAELPKREAVVQSLQLTGNIQPIQQTDVFARVYGNLESVKANIGDFVHANQLLAVIDTTELAQQDRQTAATYQNALILYERAKSLVDQNLASKEDFDNAKTAMEVAKENYDAALTRLDYAKITAPFSGYITRRYLDPGALVSSTNATLFTLMDLDSIKIIVNVLEKDVALVGVGSKATVSVEAYPGREFTGAISRMSQALDLATRTMPVEIDVANAEGLLKPGMFASTSIFLGQRADALTVPTQTVLKDASGAYVFVAEKGFARRKMVTIGIEQQSRTEIVSGLADQDSVITTGQQFSRDGGQVTVQP
jgi:membrane fusion protein, multidrug efflux system